MNIPVWSLVFHGKSAAGKSTLIRRFKNQTGFLALDLAPFAQENIRKYGNVAKNDRLIKGIYDDMLIELDKKVYTFIETGTDIPEYVLPRVFKILVCKHQKPILIYCNIGFGDAMLRNSNREMPVPSWVIEDQEHCENHGAYKIICQKQNVPIINLDTNREQEIVFDELLDVLNTKYEIFQSGKKARI